MEPANEEVIYDSAEFPDKLRKIRQKKSVTQKQLAEKLNVTQQTVSAIEKGRMEPSLKMLLMIAAALGIGLLIAGTSKSIGDTGQMTEGDQGK